MNILVRAAAIGYFVAMAIAVTYPGYLPFARVRPFILGLPFALFWQVAWICGAVIALAALFFWEKKRPRSSGRPVPSERHRPSTHDGTP
ncbi:MAG: hypothetical protein JSU87_15775 [Gemmatimonadota bacterium]|nr:MAG: hypothetical protein JSU87_15775 [Gemmatimonadota bacterium]